MDYLQGIAQEQAPYVINVRTGLHEKPELRWEEEETLKRIKLEILSINQFQPAAQTSQTYNLTITEKRGGLWVDLTVDPKFDRVLFRSDVDALPLEEDPSHTVRSKVSGVMHACGHDVHPSMLLGALRAIVFNRIPLKHNLRFVFQRAEENPITKSGGATLVEEGVLKGISHVYALHVWPEDPIGTLSSREGVMLGNSDRVEVIIRSPEKRVARFMDRLVVTTHTTGGHVAYPQQGSSATDVVVDVVNGMREFGEDINGMPLPINLSIESGKASNVRPGIAILQFAIPKISRSWLPWMRNRTAETLFLQAIRKRIEGIVAAYPDATVAFDYKLDDIKEYNKSSSTRIAVDLSVMIRGFGERFFEPGEQYSFLNASIQAGQASNVRPGEATMWFSARNFRNEAGRTAFGQIIRERVRHIVSAYPDATVEVNYVRGHPALFNDKANYQAVKSVLEEAGVTTGTQPIALPKQNEGFGILEA